MPANSPTIRYAAARAIKTRAVRAVKTYEASARLGHRKEYADKLRYIRRDPSKRQDLQATLKSYAS